MQNQVYRFVCTSKAHVSSEYLSDARQRAATKAEEIQKLSEEKQKAREQQLLAEAEAARRRQEEFASKQPDAATLIEEQDKALKQILSDKDQRQKEEAKALELRAAALAMAKQNKAKKAELKRQRALESAKQKAGERTAEILEKARKKEEKARTRALKDQEAFEKEKARDADEMLEVEEAFLEMQSELERIEMSAKTAASNATKPIYQIKKETNVDNSDSDGDDGIRLMKAKATVVSLDVDQVKAFDEIDDFDLDNLEALEKHHFTPESIDQVESSAKPSSKKKKGDAKKVSKEKKNKKKTNDADGAKGAKVKTKKKATNKKKAATTAA
jgi:hypothetical protein